jgi:uncharacterized membrane protein
VVGVVVIAIAAIAVAVAAIAVLIVRVELWEKRWKTKEEKKRRKG